MITCSVRRSSTTVFGSSRSHASYLASKGVGLYGALGNGNLDANVDKFTPMPGFSDLVVKSSSAGWGHSVFIDKNGYLYSCGRNYDFKQLLKQHRTGSFTARIGGMLGSSAAGMKNNKLDAVIKSPLYLKIDEAAVDVRCSAGFSMILTEKNNLFFWGDNYSGQSGIESTFDKDTFFFPTKIPIRSIGSFDIGYNHTLVATVQGELFGWGRNSHGQVGNVDAKEFTHLHMPIKLPSKKAVRKVSCGFAHSVAINEGGEVFVWGRYLSPTQRPNKSKKQELIFAPQLQPRILEFPKKVKIVDVCSSNYTSVFLDEENKLWAIGMDERFQVMQQNPIPVEIPSSEMIEELKKSFKLKDENHNLHGSFVGFLVSAILNTFNANATKSADVLLSEYRQRLNDTPTSSLVTLSPEVILRKGQHRVAVMHAHGISSNNMVHQVIIDSGRAYLIPLVLDFDSTLNNKSYVITDYSEGWQHSLALYE